jgi:hypothetical protein
MGNLTNYATISSRGILLYEILICPKQIYDDDDDDNNKHLTREETKD